MNVGKLKFYLISLVKRIQSDIHDDVMRDAKWPPVSLKVVSFMQLTLSSAMLYKFCWLDVSGPVVVSNTFAWLNVGCGIGINGFDSYVVMNAQLSANYKQLWV